MCLEAIGDKLTVADHYNLCSLAVVKQLADHSPRTSARRSKDKEASRKNSFPSYADKDDVSSSNCSPSTHINVESIEVSDYQTNFAH